MGQHQRDKLNGAKQVELHPLPEYLDAGLLAAAQAVEHYEISRYGTLCAWAEQLGMKDAAKLLKETLAEESATDEKLTGLAKTAVNSAAQKAA